MTFQYMQLERFTFLYSIWFFTGLRSYSGYYIIFFHYYLYIHVLYLAIVREDGARILLPLTLIIISVFARNIFNPYYATDFYEPKFFYTDGVFEKHLDVERLKYIENVRSLMNTILTFVLNKNEYFDIKR